MDPVINRRRLRCCAVQFQAGLTGRGDVEAVARNRRKSTQWLRQAHPHDDHYRYGLDLLEG